MRILLLLLLVICLSSSCTTYTYISTDSPDKDFLKILTNNKMNSEKLRLDGVYDKGTKTIAYDSPIIFFKDGLLVDYDLAIDWGGLSYHGKYLNHENDAYLRDWGVYEIKGDTIKAIIYKLSKKPVLGQLAHLYEFACHFEGIIKDGNMISQWHLISPYPKTFGGQYEREMNKLKTPEDLYFKTFPTFKFNSKDAWINQFREFPKMKKRKVDG